jgi:predicted porin
MVNPEFVDRDTKGYQPDTSTVGATGVNTDIVIKASEDLGNGMKATATYHQFVDSGATDTASTANANMAVSISGDFGTITAGRIESVTESVFDAVANIDASHDLDVEDNNNQIKRQNSVIAYASPSFNGFSFTAASIALDGGDTGSDADLAEGTEITAKYTWNGLTVMAGEQDHDKAAKVTSLGAIYKMGDLELRIMDRDSETNGASKVESLFMGAKYTMGANTFAYGRMDIDKGQNNSAATTADRDILSVSHALSKNTSVYVARLNSDAANEDKTAFGIVQKF